MHSLYMAALLGFTNSCISDDLSDCPSPQYIVQVSVKDKNYKNIGDFPQLASKEENAPFQRFEGTIYYTLSESATRARVKESSVMSVYGEDQTYRYSGGRIYSDCMGKHDIGISGRYLAPRHQRAYGHLYDYPYTTA